MLRILLLQPVTANPTARTSSFQRLHRLPLPQLQPRDDKHGRGDECGEVGQAAHRNACCWVGAADTDGGHQHHG